MDRTLTAFVIGIAGGTGSGKTALARAVVERFASPGAILLDQDSYYLDRSHLSREERDAVNFDEPSALDHELLVRHLAELREGVAIQKPRYSFAAHTRTGEFETVYPAPLIILEGLFALWDSRARAEMGLKVYLDADPDMRFIRRLRRDLQERGRSAESVVAQYLTSVRPMHGLHIEPQRAHADLVLDTTEAPLEESLGRIEQALAEASPALREALKDRG